MHGFIWIFCRFVAKIEWMNFKIVHACDNGCTSAETASSSRADKGYCAAFMNRHFFRFQRRDDVDINWNCNRERDGADILSPDSGRMRHPKFASKLRNWSVFWLLSSSNTSVAMVTSPRLKWQIVFDYYDELDATSAANYYRTRQTFIIKNGEKWKVSLSMCISFRN